MSTTTVSAASIVPADNIASFVASFEWAPLITEFVAWIRGIGRGEGGVADQSRWNELATPAGTKGENVEFPVVTASTAGVQISASYVGLALQLSTELTYDAVPAVQASVLIEATRSVRNRVDSDFLSLFASAASSGNLTGQALTAARLGTEAVTWRALKVPAGPLGYAIVLGGTQLGSFLEDLRSSGATLTPKLTEMNFSSPNMLGQWEGFSIMTSELCPTSGADDVGAFLAPGDTTCAIQLAVAEPVGVEIERNALSKSDFAVIASRYGTGIVLPARIHNVISI